MNYKTNGINDLIRNISNGDANSLGELYKLCGGYIFAIALNYVKRAEIAEEVLQNTLIAIAKKSSSFRFGSGKAWIISIAKNLSIDYLRKNNKDIIELEKIYDLPLNKDILEDHIDYTELSNQLRNLTEDEYNVIIKLYYQDMNVKEIAKELNIKKDTVYKIHTRALSKLKEAFEGEIKHERKE